MITIHEELVENYSFSKVFEKCSFYFKNWSTHKNKSNNSSDTSDKKEKNAKSHKTKFTHNQSVPPITTPSDNKKDLKNRTINSTNSTANIEKEIEKLEIIENPIKKTKYSLVGIEEAPEHLKREFILNGYRVDFSYLLAFKSVFIFGHNDFANIHSHLIPALYFVSMLYNIITNGGGVKDKFYEHFDNGDKIVFSIFIGAAILTYLFSFLYHTFGCHSLCTYSKLLLCDYLGIILLIGSSFFPPLYYAFKLQHMGLMIFYMGAITTLCTLLGIMVLIPSLSHKNTLRNTLFCMTALFGIVPAAHSLFIYSFDDVAYYIYRLLAMFAIYGAGLVVFIYKIPESIIPGFFDKWIPSHSIWHCFVAYATYYSMNTYFQLYILIKKI